MDRFLALAEPNRRRMLELIARGPMASGAVAGEFDLTSAAVSQHLRTLREAGLVRVAVDGSRRIYSLDPDGLAAVDEWIGRVRTFWGHSLDALEAALEREKGVKQ